MHFEIYLIYYLPITHNSRTTILVTICRAPCLYRCFLYTRVYGFSRKIEYDKTAWRWQWFMQINRIVSRRVSFRSSLVSSACLGLHSHPFLCKRARTMSDSQTKRIYCAQQINVPPTFPHILKLYAKAAIRTQPHDLLRWTAAYFRALANGEVPPAKVHSFLCKHVVPASVELCDLLFCSYYFSSDPLFIVQHAQFRVMGKT